MNTHQNLIRSMKPIRLLKPIRLIKTYRYISLLMLLAVIVSCSGKQNPAANKDLPYQEDLSANKDLAGMEAEVLAVTDGYVLAWKNRDISLFEEIFYTGPELFIYEVRQIFRGWEEWESRLVSSFESVEKVDVHFRDTEVHLAPDGSTAWLSTIEDATWLDKGDPKEVKDMRVTWTLVRQDGRWKIIQGHWSIP